MKLEGAFLRSRFGRRLLMMFGLAVIIPAVAVFFLTYRNAATLAAENEAATLRMFNKSYALAVFERLQMARATLERMPYADDPGMRNASGPMFSEVVDAGAASHAAPAPAPQAALLVQRQGTGQAAIAIVARNEDGGPPRLLRGTLHPAFLWGESEAAVPDGQICVHSGGVALTCVGDAVPGPHGSLLRDQWELVLEPEFGVAAWRFVAVKAQHGSFAAYAGLLLPVAVGMLLLALLLSSVEIRRILGPLETLLAKIAAVGGGGGASSVRTDEDEFATLDRTFQSMEARIGGQILALKTLQQIDQLILARVPLAEVVELVIERIGAIVGPRPIAISLSGAPGDLPDRHFLRRDEATGTELPGSACPGAAAGATHQPPQGWRVATTIPPAFAGSGLAAVWCLTVGQDSGPRVSLSLGQPPSEAGQDLPGRYNENGELEELAGRVAVALAAEARERRLVHQARHDLLTDLPNRLAVFEMLPDIIRRAQRSAHGFATLFVDLDRFKAINDGLGHSLGDSVLVEVARRIRKAAGPDALVARLGGDEFFVVVPTAGDHAAALAIDGAIREALSEAVVIAGNALFIGFTAGIALYPADGDDADTLMRNADLAMYRAKRAGGGNAMLFHAEMNQAAEKRVQLENDLRVALVGGQLHLHYQPRIDSRNGSVVGAEALVRWTHPVAGNIAPDDFIGLAEECGLIGEIGALVLDSACRQLADWQAAGLDLPLIAVNVSPHQLRAGDLFDTIAAALAAHGLDWSQLEIEITESVLVKDSVFASEQLQRLREAGCTVAIDDFGTGYSSLAYLSSLPTDTIKIDRSFMGSLHAPGTQAVVRSIIALGQTLDKTVVAEGVEKPEDVRLLNAWGCHIVQGYVYFPPLAPESMGQLLRSQHGNDP